MTAPEMAKRLKPGKHLCPVCGKYDFVYSFSNGECPVCGWINDSYQEENPGEGYYENTMSLNEAREAYRRGEKVV